MNLIYTLSIAFFFVFNLNAQSKSALKVNANYIHHFVNELHQENAKDFILNNPQALKKMSAFLEENVYFIQYKTIPNSVTDKLSHFEAIRPEFVQKKFHVQTFNPFLYGFENLTSPKKIYVDGTNYVLFINPSLN